MRLADARELQGYLLPSLLDDTRDPGDVVLGGIGWEFSPVGDVTIPDYGDFILCHRAGILSAVIRLGERLRFRSGARWSHSAFSSGNGGLAEVLIDGVNLTNVESYRDIEYVVVRTGGSMNRSDFIQAWLYTLDEMDKHSYGWLTLLGTLMRVLTPGRGVWFGGRANICSGFVAQALTRGYARFPVNPASLTPAELAEHYGVPDRP